MSLALTAAVPQNNGMHPTADTHNVIHLQSRGRRVVPGVGCLFKLT